MMMMKKKKEKEKEKERRKPNINGGVQGMERFDCFNSREQIHFDSS